MEWIKYQQKCIECKGTGEVKCRPIAPGCYDKRCCCDCRGKGYIEIELRKVDDDRDT